MTDTSTAPGAMTGARLDRAAVPRAGRDHRSVEVVAGVVAVAGLAAVALVLAGRVAPGVAVAGAAVAVGCAWVVVRDVALATGLLLVAVFLRQVPEVSALPVSPPTVALIGVALALAVGVATGSLGRPRFGAVEALMTAFLAWNLLSVVTSHALDAIDPQTGEVVSARSFVQVAVAVPFLLYLVGTAVHGRERAVRFVHRVVLAIAGYSALVSVLQFTGPTRLIWPRVIVDSPGWHGVRAVGVVNQPVENGLIVVVGFVVAVHTVTRRGAGVADRWVAAAVMTGCLAAVWLTHTRAVYLALAVVTVLGALVAPRMRTILLGVLLVAITFVALTWTSFTSDDRAAGGVGSTRELEDRLSLDATALWAIGREPVTGWGVGRFAELNLENHQRWSPETDWRRGYGDVAHETALGIGAELGVVGAGLWIAALARSSWVLLPAVRRSGPPATSREPAEIALLVTAAWVTISTTVDVRYFAIGGPVVLFLVGCGVAAARHPAPEPAR